MRRKKTEIGTKWHQETSSLTVRKRKHRRGKHLTNITWCPKRPSVSPYGHLPGGEDQVHDTQRDGHHYGLASLGATVLPLDAGSPEKPAVGGCLQYRTIGCIGIIRNISRTCCKMGKGHEKGHNGKKYTSQILATHPRNPTSPDLIMHVGVPCARVYSNTRGKMGEGIT